MSLAPLSLHARPQPRNKHNNTHTSLRAARSVTSTMREASQHKQTLYNASDTGFLYICLKLLAQEYNTQNCCDNACQHYIMYIYIYIIVPNCCDNAASIIYCFCFCCDSVYVYIPSSMSVQIMLATTAAPLLSTHNNFLPNIKGFESKCASLRGRCQHYVIHLSNNHSYNTTPVNHSARCLFFISTD